MQSLRDKVSKEDSALGQSIIGQSKDFALSSAFGRKDQEGREKRSDSRPSYKAVIADGAHVKFSDSGTHVFVTNENTGTEHQLPLKAAARYCSMIVGGQLEATDQEKKDATVLQKAVVAKAKSMGVNLTQKSPGQKV